MIYEYYVDRYKPLTNEVNSRLSIHLIYLFPASCIYIYSLVNVSDYGEKLEIYCKYSLPYADENPRRYKLVMKLL